MEVVEWTRRMEFVIERIHWFRAKELLLAFSLTGKRSSSQANSSDEMLDQNFS